MKMAARFRGFLPVVVDIETGGFDPASHAILELATVEVRFDDDRMVLGESWHQAVEPYSGAEIESAALKVTERYTMVTPYHIWYEATMEDANTFSRPWTIRLPLYRQIDPNARLGQFKCIEFVEELMYGHLRKTPVGAQQEQP